MQLNEIIEEHSLPSISQKTRIAQENLEALVARDWSRLKKVQALGFISILEREYHVDLSGLREECRAYFDSHQPAEGGGVSMVATPPEPETGKASKGLVFLVLLLAAGAGWMLFFSPSASETGETNLSQQTAKKGSFYDSVLSTARSWFGKGEDSTMVEETSPEEVPVVNGAWAEKNRSTETKATEAASATKTAETTPAVKETISREGVAEDETKPVGESADASKSSDTEEARIIKQVKREQAKAEELRQQAAEEEKMGGSAEQGDGLSEISKMILAATAGAASEEETPPKEAKREEAMEPQVPSLTEKAAGKPAPEKAASTPEEAPREAEAPRQSAGVTDSLVVMHPKAKIWVGYTNLRTMKRSAKVTTDDLTFDTARGDYILAVGHGQIDFKTRNGEKKLNDGKRHFFMIAQGGVREISHEEFQRLNKSKVW
jgi:hypothetical protein